MARRGSSTPLAAYVYLWYGVYLEKIARKRCTPAPRKLDDSDRLDERKPRRNRLTPAVGQELVEPRKKHTRAG